MSELIQPADRRLRRISIVVIAAAALLALIGVIAFQRWLSDISATLSTRELVAHLRSMIALALAGSALCLAVLAMLCARLLRQLREQRRWPLAGSKVIRATRIRRGAETTPLLRWLALALVSLLVLALAGGLLSWRLYQLAGLQHAVRETSLQHAMISAGGGQDCGKTPSLASTAATMPGI